MKIKSKYSLVVDLLKEEQLKNNRALTEHEVESILVNHPEAANQFPSGTTVFSILKDLEKFGCCVFDEGYVSVLKNEDFCW